MSADVTGAGTGVRPPKARPVDQPGRLSFRTKVALVWAGIFAAFGVLFTMADFDIAWLRLYGPYILKGIWVTFVVAVLSIALAITLALFGALGRLSKNSLAYGVSGFYTSFFRGTPLIVQLFLVYLAVPRVASGLELSAGLFQLFVWSPVFAGVMVLGFNYGAYMTEIFRAGILSVGGGQAEAADALGMTYRQRMRRVVLPQAFKVVIPPTANEFIAMTKDTALIGFLGVPVFWWDVFQKARTQGASDFRPLEALLLAAAVYWVFTMILTFFQNKLEHKVGRGYVRDAGSARPVAQRPRWYPGGGGGRGGGAGVAAIEEPEPLPSRERGS